MLSGDAEVFQKGLESIQKLRHGHGHGAAVKLVRDARVPEKGFKKSKIASTANHP